MGLLDDIALGVAPTPGAGSSLGLLDSITNESIGGSTPSASPPQGGLLDSIVSSVAPGAQPQAAPQQEVGLLPTIAAEAAGLLIPIAGAAIGLGGAGPIGAAAGLAAGGAAGELARQSILRAAGGQPQGFEPGLVATEAALSAVAGPFSRIRKVAEAAPQIASLGRRVAPALTGATEGALFGAAGEQARSLVSEGEFASLGRTALGAGVGGSIGGGIGAAAAGRAPDAARATRIDKPPRPTREFLEAAAQREAQDRPGVERLLTRSGYEAEVPFQNQYERELLRAGQAAQERGPAEFAAATDKIAADFGLPADRVKADAEAFFHDTMNVAGDRSLAKELIESRGTEGLDPRIQESVNKPYPTFEEVRGRRGILGPDVEGARGPQTPLPDPFLRGQSTYTLAEAMEVDEASREAVRRAIPEANTLTLGMLTDTVDELVRNPRSVLEGLEQTASFKGLYRLNRQVAEALDGRLIDAPQAEALYKTVGLNAENLRQVASAYGLGLNEFSRLRKALNKAIDEGVGVAQKYGLKNAAGDLLRLRRSLLVTQFSTAMRNAISQAGRYGFEGIVQSIQGSMGDKQAAETARLLGRNFFRGHKTTTKFMETVDQAVPGTLAQLSRSREDYAGTSRRLFGSRGPTEEQVINNANWLNLHANRFLDDHIRAKTFASFFEPAMTARGLDPKALLSNPSGYTKGLSPAQKLALGEASDEAIFRAQEVSFAEPAQNMFFKGLSDAVQRYPVLTLATPFPRFMASSFRFITRHNPTALLKAFSPDVAGDPKKLAEAYARATAGTGMLAAAFALREALGAGDLSTEVRGPGEDQIIDLRSFYPLSFYVTLADVIEKLASGKRIGELPIQDIRESFLALGRFSDTVPQTLEFMLGRGDIEGYRANVEAIAGDILGGFAVGLRTPKDIIDGLRGSPRSVEKKSTPQGRMFGGLAESVPFMAELGDFPQVVSPATGKDVADQKPVSFFGVQVPSSIFRQVSGLNVRERLPVESYLRSLEFEPFKMVGSLPTDPGERLPGAEGAATKERNLTRTLMGPLLTARLAGRIESLKQIKDPLAQKDIVRGIIEDVREDARTRAEIMLRQQDPRTLLLIEGSRRDTGRDSRLERGRARKQLATRFGVPNPEEEFRNGSNF